MYPLIPLFPFSLALGVREMDSKHIAHKTCDCDSLQVDIDQLYKLVKELTKKEDYVEKTVIKNIEEVQRKQRTNIDCKCCLL